MEQKDYRLAAIMYTDIVGFSRMMENDEAGTLEIMSFHNNLVTEIANKHKGTVIKTIGDAFLVDFRNTVDALQCAIDVQNAIYEYNQKQSKQKLLLRIGVHLGDIYFFENDALGDGINIAARLQSFAHPGCICFSQDVYNQVLNKIDFRAEKLGKISLKNITKEIHAFEIESKNIEFDTTRKPTVNIIQNGQVEDNEKSSTEEKAQNLNNKDLLNNIRKAILNDTKTLGHMLTVDEAISRYGNYGVEAHEVIAQMMSEGLLRKASSNESKDKVSGILFTLDGEGKSKVTTSANDADVIVADIATDLSKAVGSIAKAIGKSVDNWQKADGKNTNNEELFAQKTERTVEKIVKAASDAGRKLDTEFSNKHKNSYNCNYSNNYDYSPRNRERNRPARRHHNQEDIEAGNFDPQSDETALDFEKYRDKIENKGSKAVSSFVGSTFWFLAVNAGLWYINMQAPVFPWAAIVTASWGIGVVSEFFSIFRKKAKAKEIEKMPVLEGPAFLAYKKINRSKDSLLGHFTSALTVPALLFTINSITTPGLWWAAIPSVVIIVSLMGHLIAYPATINNLEKKFFRLLGVDSWREIFSFGKTKKAAQAASGPYASVYAEVSAIRDEILRDIKKSKNKKEFGSDMIPTLDNYVDQVKMITHSLNELDGIVSTIPMDALKKDKAELLAKKDSTENVALKNEYTRSIEEIERQEKSCQDLSDQQEVLRLRLNSSVNSLKQLKLDMARIKTLSDDNAKHSEVEDVRRKTLELAQYIDDLEVGLNETTKLN